MRRHLVVLLACLLVAGGTVGTAYADDTATTPDQAPVVEAPNPPAYDDAPPIGAPAPEAPAADPVPADGAAPDPAVSDAEPADPAAPDQRPAKKPGKKPKKQTPVDPCDQALSGSTASASGATDPAAGAGVRPGKPADPKGCNWPTVPVPTGPVGSPPSVEGIPNWNAVLPSSVDPEQLAAAKAKIDKLKTQVNKASEEADAAAEAQKEAEEAAKLAQWQALMASVRAEQARNLLDRYAAGVYRSGGGTTSLVAIVNGSLSDPGRVLDEQTYLRQATNTKKSEVEQAKDVVAEAENLKVAAARAQDAAAASARVAADARTRLSGLLASAETELKTLEQAAVSAQTLIGDDGCPTAVPLNTLRNGAEGWDVHELCARSVAAAATPEAALAIKYAFRALGAPYACGGVGRSLPFRYDCSSLVSRAYAEGAGLNTAGDGWAPSTRDLVPWDGVKLAPWAGYVAPENARPGDMVLYDTGGATYRHVVMLLSDGYMLHTNACGDVAKVEPFWGFGTDHATFLVARRVIPSMARPAVVAANAG